MIRSSNFDHVPATSLYYTKRHNTTFYIYFLFFQQVQMNKPNMKMYIKYMYIKKYTAKYKETDTIMHYIVGNAIFPTYVFTNVIIIESICLRIGFIFMLSYNSIYMTKQTYK